MGGETLQLWPCRTEIQVQRRQRYVSKMMWSVIPISRDSRCHSKQAWQTASCLDLLWSAPEVIRQKEQASQRADVYSFGIILYELIGKQGPYGRGYSYSDEDVQGIADVCRVVFSFLWVPAAPTHHPTSHLKGRKVMQHSYRYSHSNSIPSAVSKPETEAALIVTVLDIMVLKREHNSNYTTQSCKIWYYF